MFAKARPLTHVLSFLGTEAKREIWFAKSQGL